MSLTPADLGQVTLALAVLLAVAHGTGFLFARFRQPRVIGEILGGVLLGPGVLGAVAPHAHAVVFPTDGPTPAVLGAVYQLGLLLLMFCAGVHVRANFSRQESRAIGYVSASGLTFPLLAGAILVQFIDQTKLAGPSYTPSSFMLIFSIAIAVTSIPVISRIMLDLGVLETPFARIVLGAAVVEDTILYVMLAIALALALQPGHANAGLPSFLGVSPATHWSAAYHIAVTVSFFSVSWALGPRLYGWTERLKLNVVPRGNPLGYQLVFLLCVTWLCVFFGIAPVLGAFVAGIIVGTAAQGSARPRDTISGFAFAFFVPAYFAIVGLKLDLLGNFDFLFACGFLLFACLTKAASVYLGARLARESAGASWNFAIAMNARGGPGIVLASVAYDGGIINESFYATLVVLAVVTSLAAGSWLEYVVRTGRPLR